MATDRKVEKLKIFISYSRRDSTAADQLVEALLARGFEVMIDRRDLPFGEKWQAELADFIRLSDTVLWLVSDASIKSNWVNWELDEVTRRSKRLVPVMIGETARDALPRQLGEIHILPAEGVFHQPRDLDELVRVLETDRIWLKEASRLQDRAAEWLGKNRASALLLSRGALSDAERWKDRRPAKAPVPAQEVLDLLLASRQSATKRQRWWVGGSLAIAASALTLAAFAYLQSVEAERQRGEAVTQRQQALAAGDAERIAKDAEAEQRRVAQLNEDLAKKEAVEAERQRKLADEQRQQAVTARDAERTARDAETEQRRIAEANAERARKEQAEAEKQRKLADDQRVIAVRNEAAAETERKKAVESEGKARQSLRDAQANVSLFRAEKADALFRQNDKTAAMLLALEALPDPASNDPVRRDWPEVPEAKRVLLEALKENTEEISLFGHSDVVQAVVFDPGGKRLATGALDSTVRIWDASTGALQRTLKDVGGQSFPSFSPDGSVILTDSNMSEGGKLWDVSTGALIGTTPFPPSQQYWRTPNAAGTHIVARSGQGFTVWSGDIWKGKAQPVRVDRQLMASSIVRVNDAGTLGLSVVRNVVTIWDARSGAKLRDLLGHRAPITAAAFGPDGSTVIAASAIGGGDGDVRLWDASTGKPLGQMRFGNPKLTDVALNAAATTALLVANGENAMLVDVSSGREIKTLYHPGLVTANFSPDGASVLTLSENQDAIHWDASNGSKISALSMAPSSIQSAAFDPKGTRIATGAASGQVRIWSTSVSKVDSAITAPAAIDCRTSVWVPNAPPTKTGDLPPGESNNEFVETPEEFAQVMRYINQLDPSKSNSQLGIQFSDVSGRAEWIGIHRGRGIAVTVGENSPDQTDTRVGLMIWDLKSQVLIGRISNVNPTRVWGFHISPNGERVVAYGDAGSAAVFDIARRRKIFDLVGHSDIISAGCFSPDGTSIVTAGFDGKAHIWDAANGRITQSINVKVKGAGYANFTADARGIVVGETKQQGALYPIATKTGVSAAADDFVARAQARVARCLTPLERRQYLLDPEPPSWCAALGKPPYGKSAK